MKKRLFSDLAVLLIILMCLKVTAFAGTPTSSAGIFGLPIENTSAQITCGYLGYQYHYGYDLSGGYGTAIYAPFSGVLQYYRCYATINGKKQSFSYGNYLILKSDDGKYEFKVCHMSEFVSGYTLGSDVLYTHSGKASERSANSASASILKTKVTEPIGTAHHVNSGQYVGKSGNCGYSTGDHLHIELRVNGKTVNPDNYFTNKYSAKNSNPDPEPDTRSYYTPLTCYTVSTGNVTTYTSASGSNVSGYITGSTDQCVISKVYVNGRAEVTYPTPNGPKLAYANLSDFISSSHAVNNYNYSVTANTDVYRRKDLSETIGKAYPTDNIVVVGESGGLLQIIYPITGGYKLGWINGNSSSSGGSSGGGSSYSVDSRYPTPISAYTNKSSNVTTYSAVNGGSTGAIYTTDLCTISEVYTNGWCKVTYPTSGAPKTAYTEFSNFLDTGCSVTPSNYKPSQTLTVYTKKDLSATFGSVWSTDNCKTVASTGNLRQIIYPLDAGGYKMGWISQPTGTPTVNWPTPLKAYINSATDRAAVYQDIDTNPGYGQLFVDDLCTINAVYENGWVNVTYPTSTTPKTGYVPLSVFVPSQVTAYSVTAGKQVTSYQKSNMATQFGYASPGDNCIIVGRSGDKVQMIYPITGGYKLGWAYAGDFTKTLTGLSVGTKPSKTSYVEGESLSTSGLVIKASYSDNTTATVTGYTLSGYSSTPGEKTVTVTYSEGGVTKTTAFSVTVAAKTPTKLTITKAPSKVTYLEGQESFDFSDMVVTVTYNNGTSAVVTGCELFGM